MTRQMILFAPAILIMPLATGLITAQTSLADPAVNECKAKPDSTAPSGSHWYYRVNRTDNRHCWFLGAEGGKVRPCYSPLSPNPSALARPIRYASLLPGRHFSSVPWHCYLRA